MVFKRKESAEEWLADHGFKRREAYWGGAYEEWWGRGESAVLEYWRGVWSVDLHDKS